MPELNRETFVQLWAAAKAGQTPDDEYAALLQKYMMMHEDLHQHFERIAGDPNVPLEVDGENLMLHIAMDAATEKSLATDTPAGIRDVMQDLINSQMDPGVAFHVLAQALTHETITHYNASGGETEMDPANYLNRARAYAVQAKAQHGTSA
jgi:hypothetical protein